MLTHTPCGYLLFYNRVKHKTETKKVLFLVIIKKHKIYTERSLHLSLNGELCQVTSCDTKVTSYNTKLLPPVRFFLLREVILCRRK
jgi:hypothetical protein